jgi:hypothetical protein
MDEDAAMGDARDAEAFDPVSCPVAFWLNFFFVPVLLGPLKRRCEL